MDRLRISRGIHPARLLFSHFVISLRRRRWPAQQPAKFNNVPVIPRRCQSINPFLPPGPESAENVNPLVLKAGQKKIDENVPHPSIDHR